MFFDWYVTIKILETLDRVLKVNYDILFYVEYFDKATLSANKRHITAAVVIKPILIITVTLMKVILILLIMSELLLGAVIFNHEMQLKTSQQRNNAYSVAS